MTDEIKALVDQLFTLAQSHSDASKMMAEAKSLRQDHSPPSKDLYSWLKPEQTPEWKSAQALTDILARAEKAEADASEMHLVWLNNCDRLDKMEAERDEASAEVLVLNGIIAARDSQLTEQIDLSTKYIAKWSDADAEVAKLTARLEELVMLGANHD